jgi:3-oxoacyl-[acyl-carrier protein] reductase
MKRLSGKVAIVTGAGRGIGKAIAILFAAEGARVAVLSKTPEKVQRTVADIVAAGGEAAGFACDVTNAAAIEAAVAGVVERFDGVDILVNNAHDTAAMSNAVMDISIDQLSRQFAVGPLAVLRFMQACQPSMVARGGGRIINMASSYGIISPANHAPYSMAKEAIRALTRTAAREWGKDGITVNNICPVALTEAAERAIRSSGRDPATTTPVAPIPRWGSADQDIAPAVLFLASDEGQFITGHTLMADGGRCIDAAR